MDKAKEIQDVNIVGREILSLIEEAEKELDKASTWGVVDILGGGLISSGIKQAKVSRTRTTMEKIDEKIIEFKDELGDLKLNSREISGLEAGLDIFFDNIFVDFFIQGKIKDNIRALERLKAEIKDILITINR